MATSPDVAGNSVESGELVSAYSAMECAALTGRTGKVGRIWRFDGPVVLPNCDKPADCRNQSATCSLALSGRADEILLPTDPIAALVVIPDAALSLFNPVSIALAENAFTQVSIPTIDLHQVPVSGQIAL